MRVFGVCYTQYQLMSFINIKCNFLQEDKVDIMLVPTIPDVVNIAEKLKRENIFENVYVRTISSIIDKESIIPIIHGEGENFLKSISNNNECEDYERVFFHCKNTFSEIMINYFKKINPNCRICSFEEGVGTYTIHSDFYRYLDEIYVYSPSLFIKNIQCKIVQLPKFSRENLSFLIVLSKLFPHKKLNNLRNIIYLDQPFLENKKLAFDLARNIDEVEIFSKVFEMVDSKNLLVKLHPRSFIGKYDIDKPNILENNLNIPFELIVNEICDSNSVFITISSTASLTPKLLFNKNNPIIFLYKLVDCSMNDRLNFNLFDKFLRVVQKEYPMLPIHIPSSYEELKKILG